MAGATWTASVSGAWSSSATWGGGGTPADDDYVTINAGISVQMDTDLSAYTGLRTVTITSSATTPGMLYWKDGATGILKIATGYNLVGTNAANKGRLLANSNGTWGGTTALTQSSQAVILLAGTAKVDAQYLDIALYGAIPTTKWVRTYGTKYNFTAGAGTVDTTNNTIDLGVTPPAADTKVLITTTGTLPTGLEEDTLYYVRGVSGTKCKLSTQNNDTAMIDITGVGSGTITLFTGYTSGSATVNVLEDVTGDAAWTTTAGQNHVILCSAYTDSYDQQRLTLSTINAGTLVLSAVTDSAQLPGARVVLCARNVAIRSSTTTTAQSMVDYTNAATAAGVFQCELGNTGGTGTTWYGYLLNNGTGHTVSGVCWGGSQHVVNGSNHTISGILVGGQNPIYATGTSIGFNLSGTIMGANMGVGAVQDITISGTIWGCSYAWGPVTGTLSGAIIGCATGLYYGSGVTVSGSIRSCGVAAQGGMDHRLSGEIVGGSGFSSAVGCIITGVIRGCSNAIVGGTNILIVGGRIGSTPTGEVHANSTSDFSPSLQVICRGAVLPNPPIFGATRNNPVASWWGGVFCEDDGRTLGASIAYLPFGTVTKQTSVTRSGGATSALQIDPLSNCSTTGNRAILMFEWTEAAVPASAQNKSVYIRSNGVWGGSYPTASELYVEAEYISNGTTFARSLSTSTAVLSDGTTWVQFSMPEFTPAVAGHVRYRGWLKKYVASCGVYVDAQLN